MNKLFCDLKTDEEKAAFFLSGRGYGTGVIAHSIQNDVAMAYHRCAEYQKELKALQAENEMLRETLKDADNELDCLDEDMDTCDHSVGVCMCSYWSMRRKMKSALTKEPSYEGR